MRLADSIAPPWLLPGTPWAGPGVEGAHGWPYLGSVCARRLRRGQVAAPSGSPTRNQVPYILGSYNSAVSSRAGPLSRC